MTKAQFLDHRARVESEPAETWVAGPEECRDLVERLRALGARGFAETSLEAAE